jgi:hypothetical protein
MIFFEVGDVNEEAAALDEIFLFFFFFVFVVFDFLFFFTAAGSSSIPSQSISDESLPPTSAEDLVFVGRPRARTSFPKIGSSRSVQVSPSTLQQKGGLDSQGCRPAGIQDGWYDRGHFVH